MEEIPTKVDLLKRLHRRNESFIKWLKVVSDANCKHVGFDNASSADDVIERMEEENRQIIDLLAEANPELEKES